MRFPPHLDGRPASKTSLMERGRMGSFKMAAATIGDALRGFLGVQAAWPTAIVANSPAGTTAATHEQQQDKDKLERCLLEKEGEVDECRQQAEVYEHDIKLATDQLAELRLASEARAETLEEKDNALALAQTLNGGMKRAVAGLRKEIADSTAWINEPNRGAEALANLLAGGDSESPPTYVGTRAQWSPGDLRAIQMWKKAGACACMREVAANALSHPHKRFGDTTILAEGGFGVIRSGRCKKTNRVYVVKTTKPGCPGDALVQELLAYSIIDTHKNIVNIYALSDVAGSEGLVMEVAVCDLFAASTGRSDHAFTLDQIISFEADSTEGLSYMHSRGIIHCDVKLDNTLVCPADAPGGFVGKLTDPGLWRGLGERRAAKTGTLGRVPVENILGDVLAAPNQDAFAAASDSCFLVIHPDMKTGGANMWTYWSLTTEQEQQRLIARHTEGGEVDSIRADITLRTMSDGSLARVLLQPEMLNPALPASELATVCAILKRMVSRDPTERLSMPTFTAFLRRLAAKTAGALAAPLPEIAVPPLIEHPSGIGSGVGQPPVIGLPPPEVAVIVGGGEAGEDVIPLADSVRGGGIPAPAPVPAPHAEGNSDAAAAAAPLAEALRPASDPAPRDSAPPAVDPPAEAEAVAAANAIVPPVGEIAPGVLSVQRVPLVPPGVVAPNAAGNPGAMAGVVRLGEPVEAGNDSAPPAVDPPGRGAEVANVAMPSMVSVERVHLASPPVVVPHAEGDGHGVAAAVRPGEAAEAGSGSAMRGPAPPVVVLNSPVEAEPADVADISLEEIARRLSLRPFPVSPAEVMANYVADTLRTRRGHIEEENVPLPVTSRPLVGLPYRGDSGGGGNGGGGRERLRGGRAREKGRGWRGWLAGLTRR